MGLTLVSAVLLVGGQVQIAHYVPPRGYVCYRAEQDVAIDGLLDEPAWRAVPWTEDFVDIEGDVKPAPRLRTRAKMLWDDTYLYVGAEIEEPHVWATLTEHDSVIFRDPDFEIFIDPDGDNHEYYEIEINAFGTEWDLRLVKPYRDGGPALNEWEIPGLRVATHVDGTINDPSDTDRGWTAEIAFPWEALAEFAGCPCPPGPGDQWRIDFSRVEWDVTIEDGRYVKVPGKPEDNWVWSPQGVIDMHRPETWGYVQFSDAPPGTEEFRPDPAGPARWLLCQVYYAQKRFQAEHKAWGDSLEALGLPELMDESLARPIALRSTQDGWRATATLRRDLPGPRRWHIRQDSRIWAER